MHKRRLPYIAAAAKLTRRDGSPGGPTTLTGRVVRIVFAVVVAALAVRVAFAALVRLGGVAWLGAALLIVVAVTVVIRGWRRT